MATTSSTSSTSTVSTADFGKMTSSTGTVDNPAGTLDKDAFLQLFLEELKNQDPTSPMDSDKILTQTTQLTQLEAQEALKDALEAITASVQQSMNSNAQTSAIGMVGMFIDTGEETITREDSQKVDFQLYFDAPITSGQIKIMDENDNTIRILSLEDYVGQSGAISFTWDGASDNGVYQEDGDYKVEATYIDSYLNNSHTVTVGQGRVESVKFEDGVTYLRVGDEYIKSTSVVEFTK